MVIYVGGQLEELGKRKCGLITQFDNRKIAGKKPVASLLQQDGCVCMCMFVCV